MSRTPIDQTHPDFGAMIGEGVTTAELVGDDEAPPSIGEVYNEDGSVMMTSKSLRMPISLALRAEHAGHPDGFSGVVREAVTEWLQRHTGAKAEAADAQAALAVLSRVVAQHSGRLAA